jgi:D-alanine-D-alanine ligase
MIRVVVLYGGTSAEHEVSVISARSVLAAIDRSKYQVLPVAITRSGTWLLPDTALDQLKAPAGTLPEVTDRDGRAVVVERGGQVIGWGAQVETGLDGHVDVVFPLLHGTGGEDGAIQGLLQSLRIPYVGAGVAASAVGMDKALQKPIFERAGIPVTPWIDVRIDEYRRDVNEAVRAAVDFIGLPCFVKPSAQGSSVGVSQASTAGQVMLALNAAFEHGRVALVERAVGGRELEVGVLGNDEPETSVVGEVVPVNEFYDYEAKYLKEGSELRIPADVPEAVEAQARATAVQAFQAIGCEGMARVDFFLSDEGHLLLNEINTIPGFTPISMYPKLWEATGIAYPRLIDRLIELALERARR